MQTSARQRRIVVAIFFASILLHQTDRLLIGPLTSPIMDSFHINEVQMAMVFTGALIVAAVLYPVWGYVYDRFSRSRLLGIASFIWGSTTWLSAVAPTFGAFVATRAAAGIDDSSYPGLYSLVADYFGPETRGKVYGFLQLAQPIGYMLGMVLGFALGGSLGWRGIYYLTGTLGILLSGAIFLYVREVPRGRSEPELHEVEQLGVHRFEISKALDLFSKRSLVLLLVQGIFGVFPWNTITYWFFRYLEVERGYSSTSVFTTMSVAVTILASGYFIGGAVGDWAFRRTTPAARWSR